MFGDGVEAATSSLVQVELVVDRRVVIGSTMKVDQEFCLQCGHLTALTQADSDLCKLPGHFVHIYHILREILLRESNEILRVREREDFGPLW